MPVPQVSGRRTDLLIPDEWGPGTLTEALGDERSDFRKHKLSAGFGGHCNLSLGWWRSDALGRELFANGDFELSIMGSEPKIQVLGSASVSASRFAVTLNVKRIWRARYVSRCRKTHETGHRIDSVDVLGITLATHGSVKLTLRPLGDGQLEVCATGCAMLKREKPVLLGHCRRANPSGASLSIGPSRFA